MSVLGMTVIGRVCINAEYVGEMYLGIFMSSMAYFDHVGAWLGLVWDLGT